ncbi:MAG TPA: CHAT domain-containing protein [Thermoanaerobaculia bacterium]
MLAEAHADFHSGMKAYRSQKAKTAELLLRRASTAFEQAGSPITYVAALWAALSADDLHDRDEVEKEIKALLAATPTDFPAYRGFILWQLANRHKERAEWGEALASYEQSAALFASIGETSNVANVRSIVAAIYDKTGDPEAAWRNRVAALGAGGIRTSDIEERAVWSAVDAAIVRRDWHMAASFLALYLEVTRRLKNDVELATALLLRAVVCERLSDQRGVESNFAEARVVASRVEDPAYQELLRTTEWQSTAMLAATPPATADALLTRVIDYQLAREQPNTLPELLLLRARARRRANNPAGAISDVQRGIEGLERHRESLPAGAARWGAFIAAEELFAEGVNLAMLAGDPQSAFRFTEQARARSLLDSYGATPDLDVRAIPRDTVIVEYATLPSVLVIFVADSNGVSATRVNAGRDELANDAAAMIESLEMDEASDAKRLAASLYTRLVAPVAARVAGAATVVFVPDGVTSAIPFGALVDARGDYLLRHHAVVEGASASAFIAARERRSRMPAAPRSVLVITSSAPAADAGALRYVDAEARRILRSYPRGFRLDEDSAQFDELKDRALAADVIHIGSHAVGDPRGYEPASIVLRSHGEERRVGAAEIAKLNLDQTGVVVLAGCSTAQGRRRAAEGVISVAHGFLSAGVPSAVATLWPIDDEHASVFFPRLHEKLATGLPPAEALREVQLESIERGDLPPSMWAAVQIIGN